MDYDLVGRISEKIDARKRELDTALTHLDHKINQHLEKVAKNTENS